MLACWISLYACFAGDIRDLLNSITFIKLSKSPQDLTKRHSHLPKVTISDQAIVGNLIVLENLSPNALLHQND
jgi:hypothetical protein